MRAFVEDSKVVEKFKEVARKRPAKKGTSPKRCRLQLHSRNVEKYRSDQLSKLISEVVNPGDTYCKMQSLSGSVD